MRILKYILFGIILSGVVFSTSCKREELLGPELAVATANFDTTSVFRASLDSVDFETETVTFSAGFNERVNWKLTVTGTVTGAELVIRGTSDTIHSGHGSFTGVSDNLAFFSKEQICIAELEIPGPNASKFLYYDTIYIEKRKLFANAFFYDDFESYGIGQKFAGSTTLWNGDWYDYTNDATNGLNAISNQMSISGSQSYHINVNDVNQGWFSTNMTMVGFDQDSLITTNPVDIYFNMYVYANENSQNQVLQIQFREDDGDVDVVGADTTGLYSHHSPSDDVWEKEITIDWTGWKLVSVNYSETSTALNANFGGNGNKIQEPQHLADISILCHPTSKDETIKEWYMDQVIISYYDSFKQQ